MALTGEDLQAISGLLDGKLQPIKDDIQELKGDVGQLKEDVEELKGDVGQLKEDVGELKGDMKEVKRRITAVELHLENKTDNSIQVLADNHLTLIDKLNQSIKVADRSAVYEVKVNYLTDQVEKLWDEVAALKGKIA